MAESPNDTQRFDNQTQLSKTRENIMKKARSGAATIGAALGGILFAISSFAFGAKPSVEPETPVDVVFAPGEACLSFPVRIQTETRGSIKVFASGASQSTGYERAWVTNVSSGKQLELMVNGRVRIIFPPSGGEGELTITGPQIIIFFPGDAGPGEESEFRMYYFKGNASVIIDENFAFLEFAFSGSSIDLCAALN